MNTYWVLAMCTFHGDTCHSRCCGVGCRLHSSGTSVQLITSCGVIHHVTQLFYRGWETSIQSPANCHFNTPTSVCIENDRATLPRQDLVALRESVCLEVCAEMKNVSTYTVSKQHLLLPALIVSDEVEPCVEP